MNRFSKIIDLYADMPASAPAMERTDVQAMFPLVQHHDETSPDAALALETAVETINTSGFLLEIFSRTDQAPDVVWGEDPDPTFWQPYFIKGMFPPGTVELALKTWSADAEMNLDVYLAMKTVMNVFGPRLVRGGDVLRVPLNVPGPISPKFFRVENVTPIGPYMGVWLYMKLTCVSMSGDATIGPRAEATLG